MGALPQLGDQFEVIREISHSGMARVFLVHQASLDRDVVLKMVALDPGDAGLAQRFVAEARIAGRLDHPNIVTVYDYFERDGHAYIAMEYLPHGTLRPWVGRLSMPQFCGLFEALLSGLNHAWSKGIVHRDLKPDNLMLTARDELKIVDFGIAKVLDDLSARGFRTLEGTAIGTPEYMAPEQARALDVGWWTDLYSAGIVGWELLVGRPPFSGDAPSVVMHRHLTEDVPPAVSANRAIDPGISRWLEQLTARQPSDRWPSGKRAWEELEGIATERLGRDWRTTARLGSEAESAPAPVAKAPFPVDGTRNWATPPVIPDPEKPSPWRLLAAVLVGGLAVIVGVLGFLKLTQGSSSSSVPPRPTDVPAAQNWLRASTAPDGSLWVADPRGLIQELSESRRRTTYDLPDPEGPVAAVPTAGGTWIADRTGVTFVPRARGKPPVPFLDPTRMLVRAGPRTVIAVDRRNQVCPYDEESRTAPDCVPAGLPVQGLGATANAAFVAVQTGSQPGVVRLFSLPGLQYKGQIVLTHLVPAGATLVSDKNLLYVPVAHGVAIADLRSDTEAGFVPLPHTPASLGIASGTVYAALYGSDRVAWWKVATSKPRMARALRPVDVTASSAGVEVISATRLVGRLDTGSRRVGDWQPVGVGAGAHVEHIQFGRIETTHAPSGLPRVIFHLATGMFTPASRLTGHVFWQPGLVKPPRTKPLRGTAGSLTATVRGSRYAGYTAVIVDATGENPHVTLAQNGRAITVTAR